MSALPKAVQKQVEDADRILNEGVTPPAPEVEPEEPPVTSSEPPRTHPVAATPPEPQPASQPAEPSQDAAYWRARFDTLQGKYNAEVPRMAHALQETQQQLAQVRAHIEQQQKAAPAATPPAPLVTDKDDEKFGSDLIDMVRRVAREERRPVEQVLGRVEQTIRHYAGQIDRVQQVEQKVDSTREGHFYGELAREVPDWETVNKDQRWLQWLAEYDPVAGRTRQQSLDESAGVFDTRRVIGLFKLFKATLPAAPTPQSKTKSELARQVAPSRSATTSAAPQGEVTYTGADYAYWTDYRRIHDTDASVLQTKLSDMEKALAEGRIKF